MSIYNENTRLNALNLAKNMPDVYTTKDLIEKARAIEDYLSYNDKVKQDGPL